jgi:predicted DNA-binding antitoxin AbrB/MazE fold protein
MNDSAIAIYENGMLRLLAPLPLPEQSRVLVHVQPAPSLTAAAEHGLQVHQALVAAGLSLPSADLLGAFQGRLSRKVGLFPVGKSLSQLIIDEREER